MKISAVCGSITPPEQQGRIYEYLYSYWNEYMRLIVIVWGVNLLFVASLCSIVIVGKLYFYNFFSWQWWIVLCFHFRIPTSVTHMSLVKPLSGFQTMIFSNSITAGPIFCCFFVNEFIIDVISHEPVPREKWKHVPLGFGSCWTRFFGRWNMKTYRPHTKWARKYLKFKTKS
jgi:hypothetical protein